MAARNSYSSALYPNLPYVYINPSFQASLEPIVESIIIPWYPINLSLRMSEIQAQKVTFVFLLLDPPKVP